MLELSMGVCHEFFDVIVNWLALGKSYSYTSLFIPPFTSAYCIFFNKCPVTMTFSKGVLIRSEILSINVARKYQIKRISMQHFDCKKWEGHLLENTTSLLHQKQTLHNYSFLRLCSI